MLDTYQTDQDGQEPNSPPRLAHIPTGVSDYFWSEAAELRQLEATFLQTFRTWGYSDVIPPTFEYAETLADHTSEGFHTNMYRLLDRDGSTLSLRLDMTVPIARLVGTRFYDRPMPQRYCYSGSVFRHIEPQAGRQREFWQTGVELIGANSPQADVELLALTAKTLQIAGLQQFRLVLGQSQFFSGLLQSLQLTPPQSKALKWAIDRKSEPALAEFLKTVSLSPEQHQAVEQLPTLSGKDALQIIAQAETICLTDEMQISLENLRSIYTALEAHNIMEQVYLDLTMIRDLGYYTGIVFNALVPGWGFPVASGGRYDNLLGTFGHPQPAVGVAFGLGRVLIAKHAQTGDVNEPQPIVPDLLVATQNEPACLSIVEHWRAQGLTVTVELNGRQGEALWKAAAEGGIPRALTWTGQGFDLYEGTAMQTQVNRFISEEAALSLIRQD